MAHVFILIIALVSFCCNFKAVSAEEGLLSPLQLSRVGSSNVVLDDGREVRLTGIQAPKLPLGRRDFPVWPLASEAKAELEILALGQEVQPPGG
jgi:endonuclease YncB( thermonuclease family)